jgi:hypothetical protein
MKGKVDLDSISSYPGFQDLPSGIRQLLLISELHYLNEEKKRTTRAIMTRRAGGDLWGSHLVRTVGVKLAGVGAAWGKQNQLLPTLAKLAGPTNEGCGLSCS